MLSSKQSLKLLLTTSLSLAILGCASTQTAQVAETQKPKQEEKIAAGSDAEIVCKKEKVTGSNFKKKVCLSRGERRRMREEAEKVIENARSSTAGPDYQG